MHRRFHIQITTQALEGCVSQHALQVIMAANLAQDRLRGQIGHPEYHYDDSAFQAGDQYVASQRALILRSLSKGDAPRKAWQAFGRLSHAVQDFYAHSNYVALWLNSHSGETTPDKIDPLDPDVLHSPDLRSGRAYLLEALALLPGLEPIVRRWLPRDAHAWMNLDGPEAREIHGSPLLFDFALSAARKRTRHEFEQIAGLLLQEGGPQAVSRFTDRECSETHL